MSCAKPILYYNKHIWNTNSYLTHRYPNGVPTPCRWCLNCRVDRRNQWSDRAKWEYKKRLTGSFVTVTYDDIWIALRSHRSPKTDNIVANLVYDDVRKFIQRIRAHLKYHEDMTGVLAQKDFSYIYVGEYGTNGSAFDRPHFHILFFGLDFAFCKKLFADKWKYGFIDVLPILDGGINYVLKYMDKQLFGDQAIEHYDLNLLNRPKQVCSRSFGADLYYSNKDFIEKNNYSYKTGKVLRPIPPYFKRKIFGDNVSIYNDDVARTAYFNNIKQVKFNMRSYRLQDFSRKARDSFLARQNALRERKLHAQALNDGIMLYDYVCNSTNLYFDYNRSKIRSLSTEVAHWLVEDYRNSIDIGGNVA